METRQYVAGDKITMRLMRREKGALVALPSSQWVKVEEPVRFGGKSVPGLWTRSFFTYISLKVFLNSVHIYFIDACLSPYSKLLLTSPAQVLNLVAEEKGILQAQLSQEEDAQGCFIQSALCLLQVKLRAHLWQRRHNNIDINNAIDKIK